MRTYIARITKKGEEQEHEYALFIYSDNKEDAHRAMESWIREMLPEGDWRHLFFEVTGANYIEAQRAYISTTRR